MTDDISRSILQREFIRARPATSYQQFYSNKRFVDDLDIVNELDGHSGCVNALSWSKSGRLLASGSDDRHLNIHAYQPENSTKQFQLRTTVSTGHTQNIFSVKFMPHSSDNTVVTCAGDGDVRVFDLEYTGPASNASNAASLASSGRRRGRNSVYNEVKYMSDGDTNARVYRSHADRVKRVVTEDSPYLFLTCSEDGEVRQWDTRQPSSYYPRPHGDNNVPPPLISYQRFNVDLNTISCSGSQPHYIALGGNHPHCFLHDRRMAGRSRAEENGRPSSAPRTGKGYDEAIMTEATRCVRRFAPDGKAEVNPNSRGHITACKISDARPNEIVVSWSHDAIYTFDMVQSDAVDDKAELPTSDVKKRKRNIQSNGVKRSASKRSNSARASADLTTSALRIRYGNGQQEDVAIRDDDPVRETEEQKAALRITRTITSLCKTMFHHSYAMADSVKRFTKCLGEAAAILQDIDEISSSRRYPLNPTPIEAGSQKRLKLIRERARRFVQTAGCLSRVLGGRLQTMNGNSPMLALFSVVQVRNVDENISRHEQFGFDLIKAICLWLDSGPGAMVKAFSRPADVSSSNRRAARLPIEEDKADIGALEETLFPYFLDLAGGRPLEDLDINPFERDEHCHCYPDETSVVEDLFEMLDIPFADAVPEEYQSKDVQTLDREDMRRHWAYTVARSLLARCFLPVDFTELNIAFGGKAELPTDLAETVSSLDMMIARQHNRKDTSMDDMDESIPVELHGQSPFEGASPLINPVSPVLITELTTPKDSPLLGPDYNDDDDDNEDINDDYDDNDDDDEDEDMEEGSGDESSEPDEMDGVPYSRSAFVGVQSAKQREQARARQKLGYGVPCVGPIRSFEGHCNIRTVKDVNYYGLGDEYVVSGSDDGNFFIWDSQTSKLLNILEGDGEIVNVIQGHPYEPMLAVSGIDHTVKIFSPDHRARTVARLGEEISAHDPSTFSSLGWPFRSQRDRRRRADDGTTDEAGNAGDDGAEADVEDDDYVAPNGLSSRRRMHMQSSIVETNKDSMTGGDESSGISSSYLRLVARYLRAQRAAQQAGQPLDTNLPGATIEEDEEGGTRVVINDDCRLM